MQHRPFPFDADLTDLILTTLSDIHSLQSFVLSSKFVYDVFISRRASVLHAVLSNHLGPASSSAMRLLKVTMDVDSYCHGWIPLPVTQLPREEDFRPDSLCTVVTMQEVHMLASNHEVVRELESLYSWRKKDPRSSSSRLTPLESERFQTALYRVWLVCALYGRPAPVNRVGKNKSKRLPEIGQDLALAQAKFLQSFTPSQLAPVLEVWRFMLGLANWAIRAEFLYPTGTGYGSLVAYLVWSGPSTTLQAFQGKLTSVDRKVVPALCRSYEQFCEVFNEAESPGQPSAGILISPSECFLNTLKCQQCECKPLASLWSESNWSYLRGIVSPSRFFDFLELAWSDSNIDAYTLAEICRSTSYSQLVRQVFDLRSDAYSSWEPGHWICLICFRTFMYDNIEAVCRSRGYHGQVDQ